MFHNLYSLPCTVSETTGNEIPARPYTLSFISETHFLLGELHVPRPSPAPVFLKVIKGILGMRLGLRRGTGREFLSDTPLLNLVSAQCGLLTNVVELSLCTMWFANKLRMSEWVELYHEAAAR